MQHALKNESVLKMLLWELKGKKTSWSSSNRQDVKKDSKEIRYRDVHWTDLAQDGVQWQKTVNKAMKFQVTPKQGHFLIRQANASFSEVGMWTKPN
jgi:hypothetical protein